MEECSGSRSVVKKSSSGCLIIRRKGVEIEKKRPRIDDSDSSDEPLEPPRRKVENFGTRSAGYAKEFAENRDNFRNGESGNERKRSRLDLYDFDEYDEFDEKTIRPNNVFGSSGSQREYGSGSSRNDIAGSSRKDIVYRRRRPCIGNTSSSPCERESQIDHLSRSGPEREVDETNVPISSLRGKLRKASDEPIRFQGKNGVLKVLVNKDKKMGFSDKSSDYRKKEERKGSSFEGLVKKNLSAPPSFYSSDSKHVEKTVTSSWNKESKLKLGNKMRKAEVSETDESDASLEHEEETICNQGKKSMKHGKNEGKYTLPSRSAVPIRGKEGKVKRGSGTEKQLLRNQIKEMLVNAGWNIDYRPRRNRDYLDAVYISPSGTAYWSIIKAYDALQKQLEEEDTEDKHGNDIVQFTPLSEEILSKLTRQTQKKMQRELKKKKRDDDGSKTAKKARIRESAESIDSDQDEENHSLYKKQHGKSLRGQLRDADNSDGRMYKRNGIMEINSNALQGRKSRKVGRCTLMVRSSDKEQNFETDGFIPYTGKRTFLAWLIDSGAVRSSEKLQYMNRKQTKVMLEGWITRDGIHCACCSKIVTVSKFELHAGGKQRQPFQNIILESGISLLQCQLDAWKKQNGSEHKGFHSIDVDGDDPNDDTCGICGDGGDLICCDGCPSTFHQSCLGIQMLPTGDWHCPNCTCKFCGIASCDAVEEDSKVTSTPKACRLCEKKYHESCVAEHGYFPLPFHSVSASFCGKKCDELFDRLQKLLGIKHELEAGYSWSFIRRTDPDMDITDHGFPQRVECNSKLAVALSVMDECFLPIIDRRSEINLLHSVLYNCGSNFSRLNYGGFYTVILEKGEEMISAASIRIHGTQLAEMPFIGTRHIYRRQGMCRRLLQAIESALCSLKVEKLIIPAIAEHMHTWTAVFGFHLLEESHKQEIKSLNMLVFPGTDMLQKRLIKQEKSRGNMLSRAVMDVEVKVKSLPSPDFARKRDFSPSSVQDHHEKVACLDTGSEAPAAPSNEEVVNSFLDESREPEPHFSSKDIESQTNSESGESSTKLGCMITDDACNAMLETKNTASDGPAEDDSQSSDSSDCSVSEAEKVKNETSDGIFAPDSSSEACINDTSQVPKESKVPITESCNASFTPVESDVQPSTDVLASVAEEVKLETSNGSPAHNSLIIAGKKDSTKLAKECEKPSMESEVNDTGGNVDMDHQRERNYQAASESSGNEQIASKNVDALSSMEASQIDGGKSNAERLQPSSDALLDISSTGNNTQDIIGTMNSASLCEGNAAKNTMVEMKSDANQPTAFHLGRESNASSELASDAGVASNAKVDAVAGCMQSSTVSAS